MIKELQSFIDRTENFADKNQRRKPLIQSEKIDEEEHVVFSYHIKILKKLIHWINKDVAAVKSMLFEMRKENVMLNDEYNKIVSDKTRYEVEYERMKERLDELENIDENENVESFDVFVESIRDASIRVDALMTTIINTVTSKKLSDSLILIDDKDSNIENDCSLWKIS